MEKYKLLIKDSIIYGLGNFLSKLIILLLIPLYTRELTTEQFAYVDLLSNLVELLYPLVTLSIADAVFRFVIDKCENRAIIFMHGIYVLIFGNILFIIILFIINFFYSINSLLLLLLLFISNSFKSFFSQFSRGIGKTKLFAIAGVINALLLLISNIIFLYIFHLNVEGYFASIIIANILATIFLLYNIEIFDFFKQIKIKRDIILKMLKYSVPLIPNTLSWWFVNVFSRYVVMFYYGPNVAGLLVTAARIAGGINLLSQIFQQAWQYSSAVEFDSNDRDHYFSSIFNHYSTIIIFLGFFALSLSPLIIKFFINPSYSNAFEFIPFLFLSAIIGSYCYFFGSIYMASKNNKNIMSSTFIGATINIILTVILGKIFALGAVIAIFISYCVILYLRVKKLKFIKINYNFKTWITSLFILLLQAIIWTIGLNNYLIWSVVFFLILFIVNYNYFEKILKYVCYKFH